MLKTYGRVKPYLFYFSQSKRCKIGHKLSCRGSGSSRIPLHFHLPIYRSLGVTKFCVYTNWYTVQTVQIHLLEHDRVKICHRGCHGSEGLGPCQGPNQSQNRKGCKAAPLLVTGEGYSRLNNSCSFSSCR